MHLKAYKMMQQGGFFFHYSLANTIAIEPKFPQVYYFMHILRCTPSENTGH